LTLTNPCLTTTITTSSVTISQITTTVNVPVTTASYSQVADSAATQYGVANLCGARTYSITDAAGGAVNWMTKTGTTTFTITASPNVDNLYSTSPYNLKFNV
jgi:hypothetical protein